MATKTRIKQKTQTGVEILHPETEAAVVLYNGSASGSSAANAQAAIDNLYSEVATARQIANTSLSQHDSNTNSHADIRKAISDLRSDHDEFETDANAAIQTAQEKADNAFNVATGRVSATTFETKADFIAAASVVGATFKIGDNVYIKATDTPDYWVYKVNSASVGSNFVEDATNKTITIGYYTFAELETAKVDLKDYVKKNDSGTINADTTGNAATASKLKAKVDFTFYVKSGMSATGQDIQSPAQVSTDFSEPVEVHLNMCDTGVTPGTYSAVQVNSKGIVIGAAQMLEVGTTGQTTPSSALAIGGIFFELI